MMKKVVLLLSMLFIGLAAFAQTDESVLFPESIDPLDYRPTEVRLPASPLSMQVLFVGGHDSVETRQGKALAKQWNDFIGFTPAQTGEGGMGWVSVNHERIVADDKIGDGGGMTVFKIERATDDSLAILPQTLNDGRSGKFFNVQFENVGETGMNCAGITSLADGRIWTAEEWFRRSTEAYYRSGAGIRDTTPWTVSGSGFPGFDGQTINKVDNINYMVEIDPRQAEAVRKQYNWGRGGWEGGVVMPDNKTAYLGEDARPGLFTRFIADTPGDFTQGSYSYYAYDEANEQGYWVDYPINDVRDAANLSASNAFGPSAVDTIGKVFIGPDAAAMFIRNEWVAANDGKVYWAETGNTGFWNEFTDFRLHQSSPVSIADYNGMGYNGKIGSWHLEAARMRFPDLNNVSNDSVREWLTAGPNFIDAHGRVLCYDPVTEQTTVFLEGGPYPGDANSTSQSIADGYPEKHLSNPDGLNFITTPQGKTFMVICEDLNQSSYNSVPADAQGNRTCELWALDMDVQNPTVQDLIRITQVPLGAEVTGAQQTSDGKTLLVNSQHPSGSNPFPFNNSLTFAIHGWDKLAEVAERRVAGLKLIDANADTMITMIKYGDVVEVNDLEDRKLAMEVVMEPQSINGSIAIDLTGAMDAYR
ncbi:MAG: alkaline phosphatase PhoX, partial [Bacteroidota bacterium]